MDDWVVSGPNNSLSHVHALLYKLLISQEQSTLLKENNENLRIVNSLLRMQTSLLHHMTLQHSFMTTEEIDEHFKDQILVSSLEGKIQKLNFDRKEAESKIGILYSLLAFLDNFINSL